MDHFTRRGVCKMGLAVATAAATPLLMARSRSVPLRIIVPVAPGSGADANARFLAEKLPELLDQAVIVENKTGANGLIAVQTLLNAPRDENLMLLGNTALMAINPVLLKSPGYDPQQDLSPISGLTRGPSVFLVGPDSPHKTLAEFLAHAKHKPVSVGTYSTSYQLGALNLAAQAGAQFENIPYRGIGPLMNEVAGGQCEAGFVDYSAAIKNLQANKMRALAIASIERRSETPNVPTVRESGFADYDSYTWTGLFVSAHVARARKDELAKALSAVVNSEASRQFVLNRSVEPMALAPKELDKLVRTERERVARIAKAAGINPV